ncbi:MAG: hypothetical protein R2712_04475 [Vicinamibacterales bacterium]
MQSPDATAGWSARARVRADRGHARAASALAQQSVLAQHPPPAQQAVPAPTFNHDVAPILFEHCTGCHRPGEVAPMSFLTYESARPWARSMQRQVTSRQMPPWGADPKIGHFSNDPSLSAEEIATISRWVTAGAPRGDGPAPTAPAYADGWRIGTPDLVLSIPKPIAIPASGEVDYQHIEIPTRLHEDRWIQAIEIRPTNRRAVHHALAFVRTPDLPTPPPVPRGDGTSCNDDFCGDIEQHDARMGPILAASAVGTNPEIYPTGTAKLLRAGSVITLQIHYTPYGEASTDQIGVGIVFAKQPPRIQLRMVPFSSRASRFRRAPRTTPSRCRWSSRRMRPSGASARTRTCGARAGASSSSTRTAVVSPSCRCRASTSIGSWSIASTSPSACARAAGCTRSASSTTPRRTRAIPIRAPRCTGAT